MAVRKTQKKHLGKKRKSLSKRKAHSKKKRHSKQRITKKRYHKGGSDESTVGDGSTVNPLLLLAADANEIAENIKADDQAKAEKKAKEDAAKKAKEWQKWLKYDIIIKKYPPEKNEIAKYYAPDPQSIQTRLMNCIDGEKLSGWGRRYVDFSPDVDSSLYVDEKWIQKVVDFIKQKIIPRIERSPSYNDDFKEDQLKCINELLNEINTDLENYYTSNLRTYIRKNCPDKALENRLINCIIKCIDKKNEDEHEVKIEDNFHYNDIDMKGFVNELIKKIENDEKTKYVPNEELKNKLINCVRYATQEPQSDDPCIAGLPG